MYTLVVLALASIIYYVVIPVCCSHADFSYEADAISALRSIAFDQEAYHSRHGNYATLSELSTANIISEELAAATTPETAHEKYYFVLTVEKDAWSCTAIPVEPGPYHSRTFYIDHTNVMRYSPYENKNDPPANNKSKPIGE